MKGLCPYAFKVKLSNYVLSKALKFKAKITTAVHLESSRGVRGEVKLLKIPFTPYQMSLEESDLPKVTLSVDEKLAK